MKKNKMNKEKVEQIVAKVDTTMNTLNKEAESKVLSKMKGLEAPILITLVIMLIAGASGTMLFLGAIAMGVTTSPKWMPALMKKLEKKEKDVIVVEVVVEKEEEK